MHEFSNLLELIIPDANNALIAGDFNFHVHDKSDKNASTFNDFV